MMCDPSSSAIADDDKVQCRPSQVAVRAVVELPSNLRNLEIKATSESPTQPVTLDSSLTPLENFSQLPPELMAEIFTIACQADSHKFQKDKQRSKMTTPFILGHVCARWRAIVWSTPETWSHLLLCLASPRYETQVSLLEGWLARSGNCPLTIEFNFLEEDEWSDRTPIELIQMLASQAQRWHSINWVFPEGWYDILDEVKHKFSILTTVSTQPLWHDCNLAASRRKRLDLFQFAPMLFDIHLNGYYLTDVAIPWGQITRFTLQHVYLDECFYALVKTPHLTFCRIYTILDHAGYRDNNEQPIHLPSLARLVLYSATWEDTLHLLSYTSAPELTTLEFSSPQNEDLPSLTPVLDQLGCQLTQLKLTDFVFTKEEEPKLLEFVREISSLEELDINLQAHSTPVSDFLVELLKSHPSPPDDADEELAEEIFFLPVLRRFLFCGPVKTKADFSKMLLDALKRRRVLGRLSQFDLIAKGECQHAPTPVLKEEFQALVDGGLRLSISFDSSSWL
ncbi:hypothetical protein GALMADRAFT_101535 [Galerina marginata CBS 339.88]|uniref:Uncharacterized protein n=1 Tax=Galerina marginata (strain CBS 339.88) TaxID=685588 RepID=A0A067T237_GALM3|nr:hypothetical protein GALMADRAFT_101535 [Galerina marginata CBS 339.88]